MSSMAFLMFCPKRYESYRQKQLGSGYHFCFVIMVWKRSVQTCKSYRFWTGELAGNVKGNEVFPNNYVRNAITVISDLHIKESFLFKAALHLTEHWALVMTLTGPNPPPAPTYLGNFWMSMRLSCCWGVWLVERRQGSDKTCQTKLTLKLRNKVYVWYIYSLHAHTCLRKGESMSITLDTM